jgi:hypothetical protein
MIGPPPCTNWVKCRKADIGMHDEDAHDQRGDGAQLDVGGKVIARREQQPHRQHRGDEAVGRHQPGDLVRRESERARAPVCANQWPAITAAISSTTPKMLGR